MYSKILNMETIDLPPQFSSYSVETQESIKEYILQFTPIQKRAYLIAKEHLGSSFNVIKSNGYVHWLKSKTK